jgi:hypothetical protein
MTTLLIGVIGLMFSPWALGVSARLAWRLLLVALLLIALVVVVQLSFPKVLCSIHWPSPIGAHCAR